ncbi:MAG: Crp/Fnr family transcriptional regulator [Cellvibrionaceae bacterium]
MIKVSHLHNWMRDLDEDVVAEIQNKMTQKKFTDEQLVYAQGDQADCLYQVISGRVKVCNYSAEGKEIMYSALRPGDCFGEMSLIDQQPRFNHVLAMGDTQLAMLSKAEFLKFYRGNNAVAQALNLMFCRRLRISFRGMEGLTLLGVRERVALSILREAATDADGATSVDLSQELLGKMLNASRQSVGKELKFFESQGWIQVQYGRILVLNLAAFEAAYESHLGHEHVLANY